MKKYQITIIVVLVIIVAIGAIFYWQYIQTPQYSLRQAKKAVEEHNLASFEKYVDVEGVINDLIDQILEISIKQTKPQSEWEQFGEEIGKSLIMLLKPQLTKILKQEVVKYVETGKFEKKNGKLFKEPVLSELFPPGVEAERGEFEEPEILFPHFLDKSVFKSIAYVKKEKRIAYVGLKFFHEKYDTSLILDLKMRDKGSYWQVAEISNFSEFIKKLDNLETKRIAKLNKPIIEKMKQTLVLENLHKSTTSDEWGLDKKAVFELKFKNNGQKEIDKYKVLLTCKGLDGKVLKIFTIMDDDNIPPGQIGVEAKSIDINEFITSDNILYETPQSNLDITVEIKNIKFNDGSELKLYKKGQE